MTPDDKALCEALESGCGHGAGPGACVAAAARIRALAALAEARREDIDRALAEADAHSLDADALEMERDALRADIAAWPVCDDHKPGKWDGGTTCVVCEAHEEHAENKAFRAVLGGLRAKLNDWRDIGAAVQVLLWLNDLCDEHDMAVAASLAYDEPPLPDDPPVASPTIECPRCGRGNRQGEVRACPKKGGA